MQNNQQDSNLREYIDQYSEIAKIFHPDETARVLAALRQDPLVWQTLGQADFFQAALGQLGSQATNWSPGRLGLLAIGENRPAEVFSAEPLAAPGQALQERALQIYQSVQHTGRPPASLGEAALLALALRERRRMTGTWSGLLQDMAPALSTSGAGKNGTGSLNPAETDAQPGAIYAAWRTALACLYALVADPEEMLRSLLPRSIGSQRYGATPFAWIAHAQFSQPVGETVHERVFARLLQGLPVPFQLGLLRSLNLRGRERVAAVLAKQMVIGEGRGHPAFASLRGQTNPDDLDLAGMAGRALALQQMGAFYQIAG
ncbi:MAG: hypothetical protein EHM21_16115, partial [Chloroflexi bacterium]